MVDFGTQSAVVITIDKGEIMLSFLAFALFMNLVSILLVFIDKKAAKANKRRIAEKTFFLVAFAYGSFLQYFAMKKFRHKTLHKRFMIGLPIIMILQIILFIWWIILWF